MLSSPPAIPGSGPRAGARARAPWAAGAVLLLGGAAAARGQAPELEAARPADAFVDSMGVNIHSAFAGDAYDADWDAVVRAVGDVGFRYVRDIPDDYARLNALSQATGARVIAIAQFWATRYDAIRPDYYPGVYDRLRRLTHLAYIEGPNEYDQFDGWEPRLRWWMTTLAADVRADPALRDKPILAPSLNDTAAVADLGALLDLGNVHSYPRGALPTARLAGDLANAARLTGGKPVFATETGYTNFSANSWEYSYAVTERAAGKYLPRLFLDFYNAGIVKALPYELIDSHPDDPPTNAENHFGLLRADYTYKPAAVAIKNLIALLEDAGPEFAPSALPLDLSGGGAALRHTLLQKRDGTFWLALWQDVLTYDFPTRSDVENAGVAVTLTLGIPAVRAVTYLPGTSTAPVGGVRSGERLVLDVPDEVLLVALTLAGPGDANADGIVDTSDLRALYGNLGRAGDWSGGDFDGDGVVTFRDYQILESHFAPGAVGAGEAWGHLGGDVRALPEPGAGVAVACVLVGWAARRRRRPAG